MEAVAFGRYQLLELIGEGGMGKVYRARDAIIGRDVAIKVLPTELGAEPGYRDRFRREAHTAARLAEPHIIPIYDTGEIDGQLYLVMPVVDGVDLSTVLRRVAAMRPPRAVRVVEQLASALTAAHRHGLVHRDVKPSNALLTGEDFVYLIDFGIVHDAAATRLTQTGSMLGTLAYMAPERFETGVADARSDIYALTCVLHECLTGQPPFAGDSLPQLLNAHFNQRPPAPSSIDADIPVAFDEVIARGMAKDPQQRYQTAGELAAAARAALTAPSPAPTMHHQAPSPPAPAASVPTTSAPPPQRASRRHGNRWLVLGSAAVVAVAALAGVGIYLATNDSDNPAPAATPLVAVGELDGLLLSPAQVNGAMAATDMTVSSSVSTLNDSAAVVSPPECQPIALAIRTTVYGGSGWTAVRGQSLREPNEHYAHAVFQAVVLFASARDAAAFAAASSQHWAACANRSYTVTSAGKSPQFTTGPVASADGVLRVPSKPADGSAPPCQRALTTAANVVIETTACENDVTDQAAGIAGLIAAKIPK